MPPKRANKRPAPATATPATRKQKRGRKPSATATGTGATDLEPVATEVSPVTSALSPEVIEMIVNKVADEVSRRSSLPNAAGVFRNDTDLADVPFTCVDPSPTSTSLVQESLTTVQQDLSGERIGSRQPIPDQLFVSSSLPLDARVTDKVRAKIWNEEYIDFGTLLSNPELANKYSVTLDRAESGSMPSLCLEPVAKPAKIATIEGWTSCFIIFVGIYTSKYPTEAPALMKYGEIIKDLAARGHNWSYYDQNFRFLRQRQASAFPWGVMHGELWLRSQSPLTRRPQPEQAAKPRVRGNLPRVPAGFCFKYHRGQACSGCSFKHSCYKCSGDHRATLCNFRAPSKPFNNNTPAAKSKSPNASKS